MTVLAGELPGMIEGTATGSDFWLLRSEDTSSEYPVEEDFWVSAAEFADSAGADIISSSLGYFKFDDPSLNYTHGDIDGNSTFVTAAADIAASKGILVVASAGNERNKEWITIIAPSDGDSVLCTGAVDANNLVSAFSSSGPAADGRTKPDVMALGVGVPVQVTESEVRYMNGTSFSCPVISGICASVMQAVPGALNTDIIDAVKRSSDKHHSPDSLYGYGLPDMVKALGLLQEKYAKEIEPTAIISPNPFTGIFQIIFRESPGYVKMEVYNIAGRVIIAKNYDQVGGRTITIPELQYNEPGIYFLRMSTPEGIMTNKLIKTDW
jgi:subtilisin family serine protease